MSHTIKRNIVTRIGLIYLFSWRTKSAYIHDRKAYHCLRMLGEHNMIRLCSSIRDSFQELELASQSQEAVWEKELWDQEEAYLH